MIKAQLKLKPALQRNTVESVGMISFYRIDSMYKVNLNTEHKESDLFKSCPHLKEFKRPSSKYEKLIQKEEGEGKNIRSNYKNAVYKSK